MYKKRERERERTTSTGKKRKPEWWWTRHCAGNKTKPSASLRFSCDVLMHLVKSSVGSPKTKVHVFTAWLLLYAPVACFAWDKKKKGGAGGNADALYVQYAVKALAPDDLWGQTKRTQERCWAASKPVWTRDGCARWEGEREGCVRRRELLHYSGVDCTESRSLVSSHSGTTHTGKLFFGSSVRRRHFPPFWWSHTPSCRSVR